MQPIHIDAQQLYIAARVLWQDYLDMTDQVYMLRTAKYRLEMAWHGSDAEAFNSEMDLLIQRLQERAEELISMSLTLSRQGEMWDESDQRWSWVFRGSIG